MPPADDAQTRLRVSQQLRAMQEAVGATDFEWDTDDPADYEVLFVPERLLVDQRDVEDLHTIFTSRGGDFPGGVPPEPLGRPDGREVEGVLTYQLPPGRKDRQSRDVLTALKVIDDEARHLDRRQKRGVATLEHWVHVAANGDGHACPATEPRETEETRAFPEESRDPTAGAGVEVVVIDTGWVANPSAGYPLREYDGHGSFIEKVIQCRAPSVTILPHLEFPVHPASSHSGGVVSEYVLADLFGQALDLEPDIINISAGCHRHNHQAFVGFRNEWRKRSQELRDKVAVVAAAGNDRSSDPFFPAANGFAIGVGSLDKDGDVSWFTNYRRSGDVFVLGRNHVNEFPQGRYICQWEPHRGDVRNFTTGWARWSGTSFAAPLFAGLVAAEVHPGGPSARQVADDLLNTARVSQRGAPYGDIPVIALDSPLY